MTAGTVLRLKMISNRGTVVYPARGAMPTLVDHFRCRFLAADGVEPTEAELLSLLGRLARATAGCTLSDCSSSTASGVTPSPKGRTRHDDRQQESPSSRLREGPVPAGQPSR